MLLSTIYRAADAMRRRAGLDTGAAGEDIAHRYLRRQGCTIVARNYRPPAGSGEIDLVAWHGARLVFIEVKTRTREEFGAPETAVDEEKRQHLISAARSYSRRAGVEWDRTRFDIVAVTVRPVRRIKWIRDAFHAPAQ